MSLCSCSSCATISSSSSSSFKWSESSNSYRLLSSPSLSSSSITTVSSQSTTRRNPITDDEQWPIPPQNNWQIEKNIFLKDHQSNKNTCILKATMTKEQILLHDSSSDRPTIIPNKHISMKVVFRF